MNKTHPADQQIAELRAELKRVKRQNEEKLEALHAARAHAEAHNIAGVIRCCDSAIQFDAALARARTLGLK